ncbi:hypothetical protein [Wenjunlia tyrosinilytica]|nr:hypothetical protein [Wenjunlia tyrosinilytica]
MNCNFRVDVRGSLPLRRLHIRTIAIVLIVLVLIVQGRPDTTLLEELTR